MAVGSNANAYHWASHSPILLRSLLSPSSPTKRNDANLEPPLESPSSTAVDSWTGDWWFGDVGDLASASVSVPVGDVGPSPPSRRFLRCRWRVDIAIISYHECFFYFRRSGMKQSWSISSKQHNMRFLRCAALCLYYDVVVRSRKSLIKANPLSHKIYWKILLIWARSCQYKTHLESNNVQELSCHLKFNLGLISLELSVNNFSTV